MSGELVTAPRLKNPKIPEGGLNDIVLKAMAPEIHARYQRAGELLDDVLAARSTSSWRTPRTPSATSEPAEPDSVAQDIHLRLKAREAPQPRFCWHCRKPLHARSDPLPLLRRRPVGLKSRAGADMAFPGTGKIWMNGKLVDWKDATLHVASHVIHYGSGVFEGARCYATPKGSACFRLDAHMRRLQHSAKIYRMDYPLDLAGWNSAVLDTIRANEMKACYIRPILYRGYGSLGVNPLTCPVDAAILLWEWGAYLGQEALEQGVDVKVSSWSRMAPNTLPAMAKSAANYANSALIKMEALADGYAEGIALDVVGQHQRRQRPEHLHRPRRHPLHAAARRRRFSAASRATR